MVLHRTRDLEHRQIHDDHDPADQDTHHEQQDRLDPRGELIKEEVELSFMELVHVM